ncbi:MAG: 16S rRNA (uracil(1498)-N(3))-methyltransferase [Nitrospiraceae bacterium]|nr:16S rRNA (uracil(1498)-N(3))-methyltransferase [Nitrospiraceae bacterium]
MMRLYCPGLPGSGNVQIGAEEFEYAKNVLRAKPGDKIALFDGKGREASGVIASISRKDLSVRIGETLDSRKEPALKILFLPAVLKGQKMDFVIQKATELGVARMRPLITGRTQVGETRKLARWRKIAIEAARQCGRSFVPEVDEPVSLSRYFTEDNFTENMGAGMNGAGVLFWEGGGAGLKELFLSGRLKSSGAERISVAVGPEGGFSAEEVSLAAQKGFHTASLGPRILRAETAAVLAVGLVQFLMGDMG